MSEPAPVRDPKALDSRAAGAGPASERPPVLVGPKVPVGTHPLLHPFLLVMGSLLIVGVDFAFAIRPWVSLGMTALETLTLPYWAIAVHRIGRLPPAPGRPEERRWQPALILAAAIVLLAVALGEKWLLIYRAWKTGPEPYVYLYRTYTVFAFTVVCAGLAGTSRLERFLGFAADHPARLMVVSFGLTATLGGFLLTLPQAVYRVEDASLVDGLFTAVSAVCVTGLAVNNVGQVYTPFGQAIIFVLIQGGGLGIMVLSAFFAIAAGRKLRTRSSVVLAEMIDAESLANLRRKVASVVLFTFAIEAAGALALWTAFHAHPGVATPPGENSPFSGGRSLAWAAVFHAVSAFCNAGFSTFRDGLVPFVGAPGVSTIVMVLIVLGGIGFPVLDELVRAGLARARKQRPPRLSLHCRAVLWTSSVLVVLGAAGFLVLERGGAFSHLSWPASLLAALFQSVTTRTAGFNTVDFGAMRPATWMMISLLMFIGASPGSTGGGLKTTTLAVLFATLRAELRGFDQPRLLGRAIPVATARRALGITFLSALIVASMLFLLLLTERHDPARVGFEVVSAFATVGLSTGITPELSAPGKLLVTVTMFVGRIGPMTFALALAQRASASRYHLPEERLAIG